MASTIYTYNLTGGRVFPVAFEYLARRFVRVTLVGETRKELVLNVDYRFISKTEIETTIAWPLGESQAIEIRRVTSATDRLVNFTDGSILRSQDLNISQIQAIHIAEEGRDVAENSMITDGFSWNTLGRPIKNLGAPVLPTDASTAGYVLDQLARTIRGSVSERLNEMPSDRANKILGFDSNKQPIAIIPSAGSSMELQLDLGNFTDLSKGVAMVARSAVYVGGIKDLMVHPRSTVHVFVLQGYRPGSITGGGLFCWDPVRPKKDHDGGLVFSPTVPWDGTRVGLADYLLAIGETDPTGTGCFIRLQERREVSPEIFGAIPNFATDVTPSFQAALWAAVGGECKLSASTYRSGPLYMKAFTSCVGSGRGTVVILADMSPTHLFNAFDPASGTNIEIRDFRINGNRTAQLNPNDAIHLTSTAPAGVTLTRHMVTGMWVTNCKGNGVYMDTACRESLIADCNASDCDQHSFVCANSDSQVSNCISGRAGMSGFYVRQGVQIVNSKSWYSGRIDGVGRGFECRDADNAKLVGCWSQENKGHGYDVYSSTGVIRGVQLIGCVADSDNTSDSGKNGFNIVNAVNGRFDCLVRTFSGSAGSPQYGMVLGDATTGCEITLVASGFKSQAINPNNAKGNKVSVNGREGRVHNLTVTTSVTVDPWQQETVRIYLTGGITINNPQTSPVGLKLRFIFNQDTVGGRPVAFGSAFKFRWAPETAANKTNIIEFLCDGTLWIQINTVIGL